MHELGRLDGVALTLPEPGILLRPLANREALRSSSLEGTYATPRELLYRGLAADKARLPRLVDRLFINPLIQVSTAKDLLDVTFPTAQRDLAHLEVLGIIQELPSQYPRTYYAPEIYEVTFFEAGTGAPPIDS